METSATITARHAAQAAYIAAHNAKVHAAKAAAAAASNKAKWDALFAANSPDALLRDARASVPLDPYQPWPATDAGYNGPDA